MKIKAYISYNEYSNIHYYINFNIIEELPKIEVLENLIDNNKLTSWLDNNKCINIKNVSLDCEQGSSDVWNYDFYEITKVDIADFHNEDDNEKDIDDFCNIEYVAILKQDLE